MKNVILLLATFALLSCGAKPKATQCCTKVGEEISLQLYSLRSDIAADYNAVIKAVAEMGFSSVEAAGYRDGKFYGKTPAEFRADVEKVGMTVLSSHVTRGLSINELKSKDFSESLEWWDECIQAHKEAGAQYIVVPWIEKPETLGDLQTYCEYYNEIGRRCKENGLSFGYHNHAFEFTMIEGQVMYDYMIENTNPEYVFFQMDVFWTVMGKQSPVDYFNRYPGRFELLHIKDNKELGQSGMVGFDAILRNTGIAGTKHLIVEVENYSYAPKESVRKSLCYLRSLTPRSLSPSED